MEYEKVKINRLIDYKDKIIDDNIKNDLEWILEQYNSNYMEIPIFNRKYFITDIRSIGRDRWEVSAHVDVLDTYASAIKSNTAVIRRQENVYNLYLNDPDFLTYNYDRIQTKKFTPVSGFHKQLTYRLIINGS